MNDFIFQINVHFSSKWCWKKGGNTHIHLVSQQKLFVTKIDWFSQLPICTFVKQSLFLWPLCHGKNNSLYSFWCPGEITRPEDKQKTPNRWSWLQVSTCFFHYTKKNTCSKHIYLKLVVSTGCIPQKSKKSSGLLLKRSKICDLHRWMRCRVGLE